MRNPLRWLDRHYEGMRGFSIFEESSIGVMRTAKVSLHLTDDVVSIYGNPSAIYINGKLIKLKEDSK